MFVCRNRGDARLERSGAWAVGVGLARGAVTGDPGEGHGRDGASRPTGAPAVLAEAGRSIPVADVGSVRRLMCFAAKGVGSASAPDGKTKLLRASLRDGYASETRYGGVPDNWKPVIQNRNCQKSQVWEQEPESEENEQE